MSKLEVFDMVEDKEIVDKLFKSGLVIGWEMFNHPAARPGIVIQYSEV